MQEAQRYEIDWDKIKTLEDMKRLFASQLDITFYEDSHSFYEIRDLLREKKK